MVRAARSPTRKETRRRGRGPRDPVARLADELAAAWNRHDAKAFAALFATDAEFTNVMGQRVLDRRGIRNLHAPRFRTSYSQSHLVLRVERVRLLDPNWTSADLRWELTGLLDADGNLRPLRTGLMHWVVSTSHARPQIVVSHNQELFRAAAK